MLTLALPWLCAVGYKDAVNNVKELFKFAFVNEATCSFWPAELDATHNAPPDNDVDVHVCDDDEVFDMVSVGLPNQDIKSGAGVTLDTMTSSDLADKAFKEWISLKVDWSTWLLNKQKLDEIDKSKICAGNWIYIDKVVDVSQWW
jgi:hypothetical protein